MNFHSLPLFWLFSLNFVFFSVYQRLRSLNRYFKALSFFLSFYSRVPLALSVVGGATHYLHDNRTTSKATYQLTFLKFNSPVF